MKYSYDKCIHYDVSNMKVEISLNVVIISLNVVINVYIIYLLRFDLPWIYSNIWLLKGDKEKYSLHNTGRSQFFMPFCVAFWIYCDSSEHRSSISIYSLIGSTPNDFVYHLLSLIYIAQWLSVIPKLMQLDQIFHVATYINIAWHLFYFLFSFFNV